MIKAIQLGALLLLAHVAFAQTATNIPAVPVVTNISVSGQACPETLMLVTTGTAGIFVAVCANATCANSSKAPSCIALIIFLAFFSGSMSLPCVLIFGP